MKHLDRTLSVSKISYAYRCHLYNILVPDSLRVIAFGASLTAWDSSFFFRSEAERVTLPPSGIVGAGLVALALDGCRRLRVVFEVDGVARVGGGGTIDSLGKRLAEDGVLGASVAWEDSAMSESTEGRGTRSEE